MFDFAWSEFALIGIVALLFIGPKDMPAAIRTVSNVLKKGRKLAGEFQSHVDEMVRDADLGEARDQLRQLKSFNVRGQLMRALDEDGSLRTTLNRKPAELLSIPQHPAAADAASPKAVAADGIVQPLMKPLDERPRYGNAPDAAPAANRGSAADPEPAAADHAALEA
ncbi:MAG: twin-arginine translocase subunit TatB, partial [Gluconacetobacter diazotrophicus]|nr:twin-arginine translocase subunit TatB [Gluconacetobacter diazotrophicus]